MKKAIFAKFYVQSEEKVIKKVIIINFILILRLKSIKKTKYETTEFVKLHPVKVYQ